MDYEKKYKEALERAIFVKENTDSVGAKDVSDVIEYIFSELKESEDERIIKWIRKELESKYVVENIATNIYADKALAWLEKQGGQNPTDKVEPKFKIGDKIVEKDFDEYNSGTIIDIKDGKYIFNDGGFICIEEQSLWKLVEQKPADKVEPKFKVGDWVVFNNKHQSIYQVEKIENGYYILRHTHGGTFRECVLHDESLRLWTIQDAKDGDVLQLGEVTAIFKKYIGNEHCTCYCSFCEAGGFEIPIAKEDNVYGCYNATPATKKQRDFLFKNIKEAGCEWDAVKKELNGIKIITPIFNVGDTIIKKHNSDIHNFGSFTITDITGGKYWYNDRIICDITEQDEWEIYEPVRQEPTWSEDDEDMLNSFLHKLEVCDLLSNKEIIWIKDKLKPLKERYAWKPSEEQIQALEYQIHSTYEDSWQYKASKELLEQLKKL